VRYTRLVTYDIVKGTVPELTGIAENGILPSFALACGPGAQSPYEFRGRCAVPRNPHQSMWLRDLCGAVRADFPDASKVVLLNGLRIVATAEGAVPDELTVSPALRGRDVPDVFIRTPQTKRWLGAMLFCHPASLSPAGEHWPRAMNTAADMPTSRQRRAELRRGGHMPLPWHRAAGRAGAAAHPRPGREVEA
jgi:hypothetical protein